MRHIKKVKLMFSVILKFVWVSFVTAILLVLTINVPVYHQENQIETIGLITWSGLPIPYKMSAPGLDWSQFNYIILAGLIWFVTGLKKHIKEVSNDRQ